jgi:hypothetical protein
MVCGAAGYASHLLRRRDRGGVAIPRRGREPAI